MAANKKKASPGKPRRKAMPRPKVDQSPTVRTAIVGITVEGLFNLYDYRLEPDQLPNPDISRLLILYGDNGSGKTTILKLLFHLLSPEDNRGHRTFIATVPFQRVRVTLGDGTTIEAFRDPKVRVGTYHLRMVRDKRTIAEARLPADENNVVQIQTADPVTQANWALFLGQLQSLGLFVSYLPDDRKVLSPFSEHGNLPDNILGEVTTTSIRYLRAQLAREESVLESAIERAEESIRTEALRAASMGEADTNKIYAEIVKRIARAKRTRSEPDDPETGLVKQLTELEARSKAFSTLGLVSPLDVADVLSALEGAAKQKRQIINSVLRPYVNGVEARLNALQTVQELIQAFLEGIAGFYTNKRVSFELSRGFRIEAANGDPLRPSMLSSGEKQLLLLFCNTIVARRHASIFIIDEPEISLNVKWQRKLLTALIGLIRGTQVQFVIATHSIELLSQFQHHVLALQNSSNATRA